MRNRWMVVACLASALLARPGVAETLDWGTWMGQQRQGIYRDQPAHVARLTREADAARAANDDLAWGRVQGVRLMVLSSAGDATAEPLARELAQALDTRPALAAPSAAKLSLALGLARHHQINRDLTRLAQMLDTAQVVADALGQPAMRADVDAARALYRVYESDAPGAEALAQKALAATQDPLLQLEIFRGPLAIARILSINTPDAAQGLLADFDARIAALDADTFPYMAVDLGVMKAIVQRRIRKPALAQEELQRWLSFANQHPGFEVGPSVRIVQGGLLLDLKAWAACADVLAPLTTPSYGLTTRVDALLSLVICQAEAKSADQARRSLAQLDELMPAIQGSPAMLEAVLATQARAYETLGDDKLALQKFKAQRQAMVARYAKANEASRKQVEAAYQVAAKDKENAELKAREALSEQRRVVLGVALVVAVVVLAVVAELLRRQSAQRRRLGQLAGDLERLNADLSAANQKLHALNASRTRLVAAACHDLRQPAHALGMMAEVAAARVQGDGRSAIDAIRRASTSLSELLDGLFDLSRLESERYVPSIGPVSLGDLLEDLRTQFTVAALGKGLSLRIDEVRATVRSDAHLLRRMVMNLLSNAIKYTPTGGVRIEVEREGSDWLLRVRDTGLGIAPEQQEAAFSEYVRLDSARGADGLGIGLAIVRRSALLLGHGLTLESAVGQGSCFTLRLAALDDVAGAPEAAPEAAGAGQLIGVVDDDEQIRQAMCELLQLRGYVARAAASLEGLQEALAQEGPRRPDLVLSDFHLSGGDSLDALAALIGPGGRWFRTPAVLITGDLSADVLQRCQALGITVAYKPLPARKLARLVEQRLGQGVAGAPSDVASPGA